MLGWRLEVMVVRLTSVAQCWGWSEQNPRTGKCKIDFGTRMPCRPEHAIQRRRHRRLYTCLYNAHEDATHEQEQTIQWHSKSNTVNMYDSNVYVYNAKCVIQNMHCNVYNANAIQNICIRWGQQSCIQWVTIQRTMQMSAEICNWREGGGSANCSLLFVFHAIQFIHTHWVFTS